MNDKIKIVFNTRTPSYMGTRRLFFDNIAEDLKNKGCYVKKDVYDDYDKFDVVIVKAADFEIKNIRKQNKNVLIGLIHPSDSSKQFQLETESADFIISGSVAEKDYYLKYNPNIIIFPHIEKYKMMRKEHKNKEEIIIGYEGNKMHLEELCPRITSALEKLSREFNIRFKAIYNIEKLGLWEKGRPDIKIDDVQWKEETQLAECNECDIGISNFFINIPQNKKRQILKQGGFNNDYILRFKNTANAGRAFIFIQAGVPVVADMTPEHCQILFHGINGFLANSTEAWYEYLKLLIIDQNLRQEVSDNAQIFLKKYYDRDVCVDRLLEGVNVLLKRKRNGKIIHNREKFGATAGKIFYFSERLKSKLKRIIKK